MRRLEAYMEQITETEVTTNYSGMQIYIDTSATITTKQLIKRFTYNYAKYALVCHQSGETITSSDLTAWGVPLDSILMDVELVSNHIPITVTDLYVETFGVPLVQYYFAPPSLQFRIRGEWPNTIAIFEVQAYDSDIILPIVSNTPIVTIEEVVEAVPPAFNLELDDKTAIGVNFEVFNIQEPDQVGVGHTNTFTLPRTANNDIIHGWGGQSDNVYTPYVVNYYVDNNTIIRKGRLAVTQVADRISCRVTNRDTVWDAMGKMMWPEFMLRYFVWLQTNYPAILSYTSFVNAVQGLAAATEHLTTAAFYSLLHYDSDAKHTAYEVQDRMLFSSQGNSGARICTYAKSIFQFIEAEFGVSFMEGGDWSIFARRNIYIQNLTLALVQNSASDYQIVPTSIIFMQKGTITPLTKLSVRDFIRSFIEHTNSVLDEHAWNSYSIRQLGDIASAPVVDFSGMIVPNSVAFTPLLDRVGQVTVIDFNSYADRIEKGSARIELACDNRNADGEATFYTISSHIPAAYAFRDYALLAMFDKGIFENFTFLEHSSKNDTFRCMYFPYSVSSFESSYENLPVAQIAAIHTDGLQQMILKPKLYTLKKWLNVVEVGSLKAFQKYWVAELGGNFYLNKVNGFNPESKEATELDLILIDRTPFGLGIGTWGDYERQYSGGLPTDYTVATTLSVFRNNLTEEYSLLDAFGETAAILLADLQALSTEDYTARATAFLAYHIPDCPVTNDSIVLNPA